MPTGDDVRDLHGAETAHADFAEQAAGFEAARHGRAQIDEPLAETALGHGHAQGDGVVRNSIDDFAGELVDARGLGLHARSLLQVFVCEFL